MTEKNPLLEKSSLPYQLPDWAAIKTEHLMPAFKEAMRLQREAWEEIATNPDEPTVENTVEALEKANEPLSRAFHAGFTLISSIGGPELEAVEAEAGPLYSEHFNVYRLDKRIYDRLAALDLESLEPEAAYFVEEELKAFRLGGIELDDGDQAKLRELDSEISRAEIEFSQRVVKAMEDNELVVENVDDLAGLSSEQLDSFKQADGTYRIPLDNYTNQPIQAELTNPATRRAVLNASLSRGLGDHETSDTRELVLKIARLRAERAELLGYPYHAQAVAEREMAGDSQAIIDLLTSVSIKSVEAVERDRAKLEELAAADPSGDGLQAGDWVYYQEKLRGELGLDDAAIKPYMLLENVVEKGIFYAANKLYGITFKPREDLAGYLPSVKTWEVKDENGEGIGLFQADFYRRKGKGGGAWMNSLVDGSEFNGTKPVIMNNCNFPEPAEGEPCLLTWDNVITVFHEFGHALHGLLTKTKYASTAGTSVPRDFVELPSQLNEMWAYHPEVLANYAINYSTGAPLPPELAQALSASKTFGQAFDTTEFVAAALLDQAWHRLGSADVPDDVESYEKKALETFGVSVDIVPPRYRSAYFSHTFGGGYDAGYYSYMWAEVLVADLEQWFQTEAQIDDDGGLNRTAGNKLREELLARGGSRSPMESFKAVRGREPRAEALLERRGLA